jgi:tellurium resistance protein TerD
MIFGELYRAGGDWKFRAVGQGYNGGLGPLARSFGVNV